jgi:hypothetical protein
MWLRVALAGFAWLAGLGGAAHADVLGSGALFDRSQKEASCTVTNVSPSTAGVTNVRILSSDGTSVSVPFDNCKGAALDQGRTCNVNANMLSSALLYSCQVDTGTANGARFRGTMIIYDSSQRILGTSDIR